MQQNPKCYIFVFNKSKIAQTQRSMIFNLSGFESHCKGRAEIKHGERNHNQKPLTVERQ